MESGRDDQALVQLGDCPEGAAVTVIDRRLPSRMARTWHG